MAKPDPALLDPARYPFHCTIEPRFADLDVNQHINNVAMAGILEDGRVRFNRACDYYRRMIRGTSMVASIGIEFLGQGLYPEPLAMAVGFTRVGNSSFTLDQLVTQQGRPIVHARVVLVCVDAEGAAVALPDAFRDHAAGWSLRP